MRFKGAPYPILEHQRGLLRVESGINQIKADLLQVLLTNPGERVMLLDFGTPLKDLLFEPNDTVLINQARGMVINAIRSWEPRVTIEDLEVGVIDEDSLNAVEDRNSTGHILFIRIRFIDPEDIQEIQELRLELPLERPLGG
jgi:phage baseplate assembly protein W